jgi:hypothetical protein
VHRSAHLGGANQTRALATDYQQSERRNPLPFGVRGVLVFVWGMGSDGWSPALLSPEASDVRTRPRRRVCGRRVGARGGRAGAAARPGRGDGAGSRWWWRGLPAVAAWAPGGGAAVARPSAGERGARVGARDDTG